MAVVSCSKETNNGPENDQFAESMLKGKKVVLTEKVPSSPISDNSVTPYIIPGKNNGGNRTCMEVGYEFAGDPEYFDLCGQKIDYEDGFVKNFPSGLDVQTDGRYVSFSVDGSIKINGENYLVGAVIVKGSDKANIYFYPDGALGDSGLAAPVNRSGKPAGLSNITFCLVKYDMTPVLAFKSQMLYLGQDTISSASDGTDSDINAYDIGYNYIEPEMENIFPLILNGSPIGTITTFEGFNTNNERILNVIIDTESDNWEFIHSYLYVGSLTGFNSYLSPRSGGYNFVAFYAFPFQQGGTVGQRVFEIPFEDITE